MAGTMVLAVFERVAVVGAGSWGTTIASLISSRVSTVVWARTPAVATEINNSHSNRRYLGETPLCPLLQASHDLQEVAASADLILVAVPSHGFRATIEAIASIPSGVPMISLSKGLEPSTAMRMTQIISELTPTHPLGVLTGPNLAQEVVNGHPAASVLAMEDSTLALDIAELIGTGSLRVYTNSDVIGCEVAGVVKNVIAIAAGMADGMGFGDNAKAALVTRGLAEMTRFGVALGGHPTTFVGLAGVGDLVATCASRMSRNHAVGSELGRGGSLSEILTKTNTVAEGVRTAPVVVELARRHGVEMPIASQVVEVCKGNVTPANALAVLMNRQQRAE